MNDKYQVDSMTLKRTNDFSNRFCGNRGVKERSETERKMQKMSEYNYN